MINTHKDGEDNGYYLISHDNLFEFMKKLEGKLLTIVEASYSDKEQRESVKSLVRENLWREFQRLSLMSACEDNLKIVNCTNKIDNSGLMGASKTIGSISKQ